MTAYYNEIDRYCCDWLQNLMDAGHITPGKIDDRRIENLSPDDVRGYERVHFFAGIAGWDHALNLAGWRGPVWTGSCPCQPFSAAGQGKAADDERHLWPAWFSLIRECGPAIVFGEQVEAAIGWGWLDAVFSDLEAEGYACGAAVLPACSVGAPHIRQRVWFVADSVGAGLCGADRPQGARLRNAVGRHGATGELADSDPARCGTGRPREAGDGGDAAWLEPSGLCADGGLAHSECNGGRSDLTGRRPEGGWTNTDWITCTDGKARPVEPSTFPLAHGVPGRVGRLRAYGNAIVPQVAAEFIAGCLHHHQGLRQ